MQELEDNMIKIAKLSPLEFQNVREWREDFPHPLGKLVLLLPAQNPTSCLALNISLGQNYLKKVFHFPEGFYFGFSVWPFYFFFVTVQCLILLRLPPLPSLIKRFTYNRSQRP